MRVCGHAPGYAGTYYSLAKDPEDSPYTIIKGLGLEPHPDRCSADDEQSCSPWKSANGCWGGCWGSNLDPTWKDDKARWAATDGTYTSIVRCTNKEGKPKQID